MVCDVDGDCTFAGVTQDTRAVLPGTVIVQRRRKGNYQQREEAGNREQAHEKQAATINGSVHVSLLKIIRDGSC